MGQLNETKYAMASLFKLAEGDFETVIINNTPDPQERAEIKMWIERFLKPVNPQRFIYIEQENPGLVMTMQKGYELATTDILAFFHNDVIVYEKGWDTKVRKAFEEDPTLGLAGWFGHEGVHHNGGRQGCWSAMLEAEYHGNRLEGVDKRYITSVDGFSIICRKEMLDKKGGFDTKTYKYHHLYDKDIGLESLSRGYRNIVMNIECHHISGVTANRTDWQNQANQLMGSNSGDMDCMRVNMDAFNSKWGHILPIIVNQEGKPNLPVTSR